MNGEINETLNQITPLIIVKGWDRTEGSLRRQPGLEPIVLEIGFDLPTLTEIVTKVFPQNINPVEERNSKGEKTEDVTVEVITVNSRPLDRLLVKAYQPAANPNSAEMTQFQIGGEVILLTSGEADLTYADKITDGLIAKADLKTVKLEKGDLVISMNTPNNWTRIGGNFSFIYFVGNPAGPQKYPEVPKVKIHVK